MKKQLLSLVLCLSVVFATFAQTGNVGIGTSTPNPAARLDVTATDRGFIAPRVALNGATIWTLTGSPTDGMIVYNTATVTGTDAIAPGYFYWQGAQWYAFYQQGSTSPTPTAGTYSSSCGCNSFYTLAATKPMVNGQAANQTTGDVTAAQMATAISSGACDIAISLPNSPNITATTTYSFALPDPSLYNGRSFTLHYALPIQFGIAVGIGVGLNPINPSSGSYKVDFVNFANSITYDGSSNTGATANSTSWTATTTATTPNERRSTQSIFIKSVGNAWFLDANYDCHVFLPVGSTPPPAPPVFTCAGITTTQTPTGALINGTSYTGTVTVPYTAGNGVAYGTTTQTINGLTLTRVAGTYNNPTGNVVYNLSGTYTGTSGYQSFPIAECPATPAGFGDAVRGAMASAGCASCPAYDGAANMDWVRVTAAEYNAAANTVQVAGAGRYWAPESYMTAAADGGDASLGNGMATVTGPSMTNVPASNYVYGFSWEAGNSASNAGTVTNIRQKIKTTDATVTGPYVVNGNDIPSLSWNAGTRYYYLQKRATQTTWSGGATPVAYFSGVAATSADRMFTTAKTSTGPLTGSYYRNSAAPNPPAGVDSPNMTSGGTGVNGWKLQVLGTPTRQW